ncbi:hypothetical protein L5I01_19030 [Gordonia sp. HY442]|uniref:hypothetical protein n=1 Tax=Gordonia zhenghanii TaxID=2911516 RepID=UPI001F3C9E8D|nr:hypothetical protein [Gordonia zhenghanii]MCF8605450.1 hypothetical protein [Gordonia zhenghanii]
MAAERPNQRRPRKVAGRTAARVELSQEAQDRRKTTGDQAEKVALTKKPSATDSAVAEPAGDAQAKRTVGLRKPESGVDRKRNRVEAEREVVERERARTDVEPGVNDTKGTYRLAAVLGAVAVVIAAIAAVLGFHPGADVSDNKAFVDQEASEKVLSQARTTACAPFQFKYQNLDHWLADAESKLSGSAGEQFKTHLNTNRSIIEQTKASSECRVETVGLMDLTRDRATVLAALQIDITRDGALVESNKPKTGVVLVRNGDDWLVDQFLDP